MPLGQEQKRIRSGSSFKWKDLSGVTKSSTQSVPSSSKPYVSPFSSTFSDQMESEKEVKSMRKPDAPKVHFNTGNNQVFSINELDSDDELSDIPISDGKEEKAEQEEKVELSSTGVTNNRPSSSLVKYQIVPERHASSISAFRSRDVDVLSQLASEKLSIQPSEKEPYKAVGLVSALKKQKVPEAVLVTPPALPYQSVFKRRPDVNITSPFPNSNHDDDSESSSVDTLASSSSLFPRHPKKTTDEEYCKTSSQPSSRTLDRPSFLRLLGKSNKVSIKKAGADYQIFFSGKIKSPLGVSFDVGHNEFICCDTDADKIMLIPGMRSIASSDIHHPAAVTVVEHGHSFAVLGRENLVVFRRDGHSFSSYIVASNLSLPDRNGRPRPSVRGLGVTDNKNLVTINWIKGQIILYKNEENTHNHILATFDYKRFLGLNRCAPSFLDVYKNRLAISDLGAHVLSTWEIEESDQSGTIIPLNHISVGNRPMGALPPRGGGGPPPPFGKCRFISGVQLDENGYVMVADADGATLQIFSPALECLCRVHPVNPISDKIPYVSDFVVISSKSILVCDRRNRSGGLVLYQLENIAD